MADVDTPVRVQGRATAVRHRPRRPLPPAAPSGRINAGRRPRQPTNWRAATLEIPVEGVKPTSWCDSFNDARSGGARARGDRHPGAAQHAGDRGRGRHHRAAVLQQGGRHHDLPVRPERAVSATTTPTWSATRTACRKADSVQQGQVHRLRRHIGQCPQRHAPPALRRLPADAGEALVGRHSHRPLRHPAVASNLSAPVDRPSWCRKGAWRHSHCSAPPELTRPA